MANQRGLTTIELIVSLFILAIILTAAANFYEFYTEKSGNLGEFVTARNLGVGVLETQLQAIKVGDTNTGEVYREHAYIKGTDYEVVATKSDETQITAHYNSKISFYKVTTHVYFEDKEIEVSGYATAE
ncbi:prepilin-type N-terminal cleavage/methylation domain-containing protein [Priestia filamentosa]|uniref:type IV pilus modification PilV family protein n=1 Tax=Priestia filamentosa TaxID=1402861 RepID=UPI0005890A45